MVTEEEEEEEEDVEKVKTSSSPSKILLPSFSSAPKGQRQKVRGRSGSKTDSQESKKEKTFTTKTAESGKGGHTHRKQQQQHKPFLLLSSLLLLLLPRSLVRAFLYFSSPARQLHSSSSSLPDGGSSSSMRSPGNAHREPPEGAAIVFTSWLLTPLGTLSESSYLVSKSATVTQLKYRLLQLAICWRLLRRELLARRRVSLALGNALSSVLIDVALGVATILALHYYSTPAYWLERAWQYADSMVDDVDRLLRVLQSMPAGLKLNRPLNMALSQFYLYHIYLWESYMDIIRPVFGLVMQAIFYLGIFGFTCILR